MNNHVAQRKQHATRDAKPTDRIAFDPVLYQQLKAFLGGNIASPVVGNLFIGKKRAEQYLEEYSQAFESHLRRGASAGTLKERGLTEPAFVTG
jgi:ssRNA-specific RNase YbeY (16S rRNA maturation enzyme)